MPPTVRTSPRWHASGAVLSLLLLATSRSLAQSLPPAPSRELTASRTASAPAIDGRDDDPAWTSGPVTDDFRDFAPREGIMPTLRTSARIRYDDRAIYFFVRAFDPAPDSVVRRLARRDTPDATADQILLFLDPFHDGRTGYEFIVTAGGVKTDATLFEDEMEDFSWDGVWEVATRLDSLGWTAEFAIPFSQLRFGEHRAPAFGLIVGRWVGRSGERMSVPQYSRAKQGLISQAGVIVGLRDLVSSRALEATPYSLARVRNLVSADARSTRLETRPSIGADLKWVPRPSVSVEGTINPDFGQVEADPAVVNLSGFEVFQTERRPFFVEGGGLLALPLAPDGSGQLFYSRRVGRPPTLLDDYGATDSPTETTILGAAKVMARLTPTTVIAALSALTGTAEGRDRAPAAGRFVLEPRASNVVARVQQNFRAGRSGVGVMMTRLDRSDADSLSAAVLPTSAQSLALTTQHQTRDGAYQASGWVATSDVRGDADAVARLQLSPVHAFQRPDDGVAFDPRRESLRGSASYLSLGKVGGGITRFSTAYRRIDPGFDPNDLGFLTTSGVQSLTASAKIDQTRPGRIAGVPYRRANLSLAYAGEWSSTGLPYARTVTADGGLQLDNLAVVQGTVTQQLPGALCAVSCTRGGPSLVDPPRTTVVLDISGDPRRVLVPHVNAEYDRDDEGRSNGGGAQLDVTWRPRSNLDLSLAAYAFDSHYAWFHYGRFGDALSDTAHYTVARLDLRTRSLTSRVNYTLTTALTVQWYGQAYVSRGVYDDVRELADARAVDYARRFRPYGDAAVRANPGGVDFKQLRSNLVVRWEYRPGSALFVVWSQARDVDGEAPGRPGLWPARDFNDLLAIRPQNAVAVKLSYRLSR